MKYERCEENMWYCEEDDCPYEENVKAALYELVLGDPDGQYDYLCPYCAHKLGVEIVDEDAVESDPEPSAEREIVSGVLFVSVANDSVGDFAVGVDTYDIGVIKEIGIVNIAGNTAQVTLHGTMGKTHYPYVRLSSIVYKNGPQS